MAHPIKYIKKELRRYHVPDCSHIESGDFDDESDWDIALQEAMRQLKEDTRKEAVESSALDIESLANIEWRVRSMPFYHDGA